LRFVRKEGFGRSLPTLDGSKGGFQSFGELLTPIAGNPFDPLFDSTVWPNREANSPLGHKNGV
jgi:hypothetical protein